MGLIYSSGDSSALMGALSANLAAATSMLESTVVACDQLISALGGGQLSGRGYASAKSMFTEAIRPGLTEAKTLITDTQTELASYTQADSLVSQYGVLNEDELNAQLTSVKAQRDATESQIQTNSVTAAASATLPGVAAFLEASNSQLEFVLSQLESEIKELEDKLQALHAFNSQTAGLFDNRLKEFIEFMGGPFTLVGHGTDAGRGTTEILGVYGFLQGRELTQQSDGRIKLGARYVYKPSTNFTHSTGKALNAASGGWIAGYKQPLKAGWNGVKGSVLDTVHDDYRGWNNASKYAKWGKGLGIAGTSLTVGANAYDLFQDGAPNEIQVRDFAVDTAVDLGSAAAAAGVGAAAGSFVLPPLGTVVGAGVGLLVNVAMNVEFPFLGDRSLVDVAKDGIKGMLDGLGSLFW